MVISGLFVSLSERKCKPAEIMTFPTACEQIQSQETWGERLRAQSSNSRLKFDQFPVHTHPSGLTLVFLRQHGIRVCIQMLCWNARSVRILSNPINKITLRCYKHHVFSMLSHICGNILRGHNLWGSLNVVKLTKKITHLTAPTVSPLPKYKTEGHTAITENYWEKQEKKKEKNSKKGLILFRQKKTRWAGILHRMREKIFPTKQKHPSEVANNHCSAQGQHAIIIN